MYRNGGFSQPDAFIIAGGLRIGRLDFNVAYDTYVSSMKRFNNNVNAFEFVITYNSISSVLNLFTIPCERL